MQRPWVLGPTLAACLTLSVYAVAQGNYTVETIGAPASPDVSQALVDALEAQGTRLAGDQGVFCEVWLRKAVPLQADASDSSEVLYGALGNGTFLGVLHFPSTVADFRGQPIKPGYYVMRYALIPQDGAHMGVYATRDTVLLSPVAADTEIDKNLGFGDLVKLSCLASGTPHPAFLVMSPVSEGEGLPAVAKDEQGHWNLQLKLKGASKELPIAITLVGRWEGA
jgi:hypothetical protein